MKLWTIPGVILSLGLLSLVTLSSIAPLLAPRQLIFFILGFGVFFIISRISFKRLQELSFFGYVGTVFLLIVTLLIGNVVKGSANWIDVGGVFAIQASQLAVPVVALFVATFFEKRPLTQLKNLGLFLAIVALPALLIVVAPDLGTTAVYVLSLGFVLYLVPTRPLHMLPLIALGLTGVIIAWFFLLQPYQKARITSFIAPTDTTQSSGYNARQSLIAAGSGQFTGRGLGQGVQSHLRFLPERQTDFVFASLAEEFGFIGSIVVLILYTVLGVTTIATGLNSQTQSEQLFCAVVAMMLIVQVGVNIGMNIGIVPITGITLPFLSYGGSSILSLLATFGIVESIKLNQKQKVTLHLN